MALDSLFSEDLESYRQLEAEKGALVIKSLVLDHRSSEFFRGAMWMLNAIIKLPQEHATTKEQKERALFLKEAMLRAVEIKVLRAFVDDHEEKEPELKF